jgi:hypothetical protein
MFFKEESQARQFVSRLKAGEDESREQICPD